MNNIGKLAIVAGAALLLGVLIGQLWGQDTTMETIEEPMQESMSNIDLVAIEGRAGYSIGVNIGMNLASQGIAEDIDIVSLIEGISNAAGGEEIQMSDEDMAGAIQEITMLQQAKAMAEVEADRQVMVDFMANNALQEGVTTTDSGLQYEVLTAVEDASMPSAEDTVNVHYHGTLIDGTVFDSSVERNSPVSFPLNGVISGWTEGLQLMKVGEKFRFTIPSDLAYGANGAPQAGIGPDVSLIFEVELLDIE